GVLVTLDENCMQSPIKIFSRADERYTECLERIEYGTRPDRNSGRSQCARKVKDIFGEAALRRGHELLRRPQLGLHLVEERLHFGTIEPGDVILVFEQYAKRVRHGRRIKRDDIKLGQRASPVQCLGNTGRFEQVLLAERLYESNHLLG